MSSRAIETRPGATAPSLRRRLLWLVLAAIALASAIQAATAYRTALRNADALFDLQLAQFAQSVDAGVPLLPAGARLYEFSVQVWGNGGVLLYRSQGLDVPPAGVLGFSEARIDGTRYRLYRLSTGQRTIQVAQNLDARQARARRLAMDAVMPVLLLAPLLMVAVWLLITHSLKPLERMRREVAERPAEDLSPLAESGVPAEVLPLVRELNQLFRRVDEAFASQRHFVADAAHELRSPLTALKLQAQALHDAPAGPEHAAAVERLEGGIERAIQLLSQLLALARADSELAGPQGERVDVQALCRAAVADVLPQAHARNVDLGLQGDAMELGVDGHFEPLRMLLRNLLDNAVKFAPAGGRVDLSVAQVDGRTCLRVDDNGPGIPREQRRQVFERFYRGDGRAAPGSGLGLAIVRAIAQRHGAQVRLDQSPSLGGLRAEVCFPAPRAP